MLTFLFWSDPKPSAQQKAPVSDGTPETTVEGVSEGLRTNKIVNITNLF